MEWKLGKIRAGWWVNIKSKITTKERYLSRKTYKWFVCCEIAGESETGPEEKSKPAFKIRGASGRAKGKGENC
jgi:hypothetical protein